ncbi:MAG: mechanosensitive ion channel family protein [Myxococcales bacterium]
MATIDPATLATPARIEALQTLSTGVHPGVPLDSLLPVSLDDDSSMNERDKAVRLERRKVLIASRVGERFGNRSPEEMAQMRDQVLALDLERKVLALPIEVRSRLIDEDAQRASGGQPASSQGTPATSKASEPQAKSPGASGPGVTKAPARSNTQPASASSENTPTSGKATPRSLFASFLLLLGLLFAVWLGTRLFRAGVTALAQRAPAQRGQLTALSGVGSLVIGVVGVLAAPFAAFANVHESALGFCGALAFALLALGCRDLAASMLAGCVLTLKRPFRSGDRIEVAGIAGKVLQVGLTSTQLLTSRNQTVTLPNRTFLNQPVSAPRTESAVVPLEVDFYVDANQDAGAAKRIFAEVLAGTRGADLPKGQSILLKQLVLGHGTVVRLRARVFVNATQADQIESELTERMLEGLRTGGIRAPSQVPTTPNTPPRTREPTEPFAFGG